jgi:hypothetical protein
MRIKLTGAFVTLLASTAVAALIASPVMAKPTHKPSHQPAAALNGDVAKKGAAVASAGRVAHSPNPAWDVYNHSGEYIGSDPDPRIRNMMLIQSGFRD